jgi:hypothetical protein
MSDSFEFCFPVSVMLSFWSEVYIYGFVTKLTLGEGGHHCFLVKLGHLSPRNLSELIL